MNYQYLLQRLALTLVVIIGVTLAVFLIVQLIPGDPARVSLGLQATEEKVETRRETMGLNRPVMEQYLSWVGNAIQGDFGRSLITGASVSDAVSQRLPATLQLAFLALLIGMAIAFPLGIISAMNPNSPIDFVASLISQVGVAIPDFWLSIMLILLFSTTLDLFPPSGYTPIHVDFWDWLDHMVLPAVTAGLISASIQTRFIRSAMLEVLSQNYIKTARAKGLRERVVITRHALRNALITIVTIVGLQMTALLSAVVVIEIVFNVRGLGSLALDAVLDRDYTLLQGAVFVMAVLVTVSNLIVDMTYFFLDPRIEYS
jgi:peptide/nickel transport system permease protein